MSHGVGMHCTLLASFRRTCRGHIDKVLSAAVHRAHRTPRSRRVVTRLLTRNGVSARPVAGGA